MPDDAPQEHALAYADEAHQWQQRAAALAREGMTQRERIRALEEALRALVAVDPESGVRWDAPERPPECQFCRHFSLETPWQLTHAPTCPWVSAGALLKGDG